MSRQLASRNNHFTTPALPGPVVAFRAQTAGVEFDGVVALSSAMSPSEKRIAEQALTDRRYGQRTLPGGMTVYVLRPVSAAPSPAQPTADRPKPKLSKQQRAAAEKKLVADLAALVANVPAAVKPKRMRNRHDNLAAARAVKQMITGQ